MGVCQPLCVVVQSSKPRMEAEVLMLNLYGVLVGVDMLLVI